MAENATPTLDHALDALFNPRSIAVVGASDDPAKWGNWISRNVLKGAHRREVYLVNRRGGELAGYSIYPSLRDLPAPAEMVVLAIPAGAVEATIEDALAAGTRVFVAITAGFGEQGAAGQAQEARIVQKVRDAGARLLGPNCMGVSDASAELYIASGDDATGPIALVSQSGNLGIEIGMMLQREGLGFSRVVSLGNQADIGAEEVLDSLIEHPETRAILLYLEGIRDGRRLVASAQRAWHAGKPVVLIAAGVSQVAARAARSHTGALATAADAIAAACRAGSIIQVATPRQAIAVLQVMLPPARPQGPRLGIVADGGGHGVLAADLATAAGLTVPALSEATQQAVRAHLPATASVVNPVDMAGGGEQDFGSYGRVAQALLESGELDAVLFTGYFGGYSTESQALGEQELASAQVMAGARDTTGRALLMHSMHFAAMPNQYLRQREVPVYAAAEDAVEAIARAARWQSPPAPPLALPARSPVVTADDYWSARALLAGAGIPVAAARLIPAGEPAESAGLRYPLVAKALGLNHKSDAGGVLLNIANEAQLLQAVADLRARLAPPAIVIEEQAPVSQGIELIIGCRQDPAFGPLVMVGFGGIYAEILRDTAVALGPISEGDAETLIRGLRGSPLLLGARGRPVLDISAAAAVASKLSLLAASHPEIAALEINPLLVLPAGVVALDARVTLG
ncbi:MAG: acetate--CoA ligase family protein [Thermomicrobiales bacterium]